MNIRIILPVAAGLMLVGNVAFARGDFPAPEPHDGQGIVQAEAALAPYDHCVALQKQFDEALKTSGTAAKVGGTKVGGAKALRASAGKLCGGNQFQEGIRDMRQALFDIGVKPQS